MNKNAKNLQVLKDIVGDEQFRVIAELLHGEHIVFNNYSRQGYVSKEEQNADIVRDFYNGMSKYELAFKYELGVDAIYKIVEQKN